MARPKEFDESTALSKAVDTFWEHGFDGTGMQDLCAEMNLNVGSLYGTFGDKRALFIKVLDRYTDTVSRQAIECIGSASSGMAGIRAFFVNAAEAMAGGKRRWGCLITNSIAELALHDPEIAAKVKLHLARVETTFASALARARTDGEVSPGVGPESAAFLLCVLQGLNVLAKTKPGKQVIEGIVDVALKGLTSTALESTHRRKRKS